MSSNVTIHKTQDGSWTQIVASGSGPFLLSVHGGQIEWQSGSSLPSPSTRGHLLLADDVPPNGSQNIESETYYFSRAIIQNIYAKSVSDTSVIAITTDAELYGS